MNNKQTAALKSAAKMLLYTGIMAILVAITEPGTLSKMGIPAIWMPAAVAIAKGLMTYFATPER